MSVLPDITVDLAASPPQRWVFAEEHVRSASELLRLGIDAESVGYVAAVASGIIPGNLLAEMEAVGDRLGVAFPQVVLANLYYDLLKVVIGCTAFSLDSPTGPIHARNLDWWTTARALNDGTVVTRFLNGPAGEFVTVGWPGFVGALSGVATKRFAVTLNAVLSDEPGQMALPIVMLIRQVLEEATGFSDAVERLSSTTIASDCLLLVTGTDQGQRVVIERTPTNAAHRIPSDGEPLYVTNEFIAIDADATEPANELMRTSCGRYDRIAELLRGDPPADLEDCIALLSDDQVMMSITVQQMAFRANTGEHLVRVP